MSINISAFAGAGAQFFDSNGAPLSGGLIYTYAAGTTTNAVTYTSRTGAFNNTNPIILDSAGRTPAEIWMDGGSLYKFVLKDSTFVQIGSYDNIPAINDATSVNSLLTVAGTNTLTGSGSPVVVAYTAGAQYSFVAQNNNTGAVTINIDTLGAKSVTKYGTTALAANDLVAGSIALIEYDGTRFQLINPVPDFTDRLTTSIKTSAFAAVATNTYAVNTSAAAITATLPASPVAGDYITFTDYARTFGTYNLTLAPNGNKINASTNNVVLSVSGEAASIVYIDATQGWLCYSGFTNNPTTPYAIDYLVVSGGGGSSYGAGGAGGVLASTSTLTVGTAYVVTIGLGGAAGTPGASSGSSGIASSLASVATSVGGGGGAGVVGGNGIAGGSGGSGMTTGTGGAGTAGQGFAGGTGAANVSGGGGGAGAVGVNATADNGGAGGAGVSNSISGAAVTYGGGGGGKSNGFPGAAGGAGGGGAGGGSNNSDTGVAGSANTGGGAGGGNTAAAGGSGIVALRYLGTQRGTGGTVTSAGGYTIHTFTTSGTYNA
jgi:hypothetical protein